MRILIDLRCLETESAFRGIGRYARELARALLVQAPRGWSLAGLSWTGSGSALGLEDVVYPGPRRGIGWADRWVLPDLLRKRGVDLYHATAYALPAADCTGTALVLTIHDLVADVYPEALSWRHRLALRRTFRSARVAHRVVTVSQATRRDLLGRYPVEARRVVVVPNGVLETFFDPARPASNSSGLPRPFLLYVGGLDPLKNAPFLLQVLQGVRREIPDMHLVLAGARGARHEAIEREASEIGLGGHVHAVGFLEDNRLAAAYREATAFVFPSLYEGFGLPPLEAMASGCPVISSPAGALAEVLDGAGLLREPSDAEAWARAVVSLWRDPEIREDQVRAGRRRASTFTWGAAARETLAVYESALEEASRA